jgi:hypothetical protein
MGQKFRQMRQIRHIKNEVIWEGHSESQQLAGAMIAGVAAIPAAAISRHRAHSLDKNFWDFIKIQYLILEVKNNIVSNRRNNLLKILLILFHLQILSGCVLVQYVAQYT